MTPRERNKLTDVYENVLIANEDELYLHHSEDYKDGFIDGAYVLFRALTDGGE